MVFPGVVCQKYIWKASDITFIKSKGDLRSFLVSSSVLYIIWMIGLPLVVNSTLAGFLNEAMVLSKATCMPIASAWQIEAFFKV